MRKNQTQSPGFCPLCLIKGMINKKIKRIIYKKDIWARKYRELHPKLLKLSTSKNRLIVICHGKPPYEVVLGVPHQAAIGEESICEDEEPRPSDENAASYALVTFDVLKKRDVPCKLVIMARSTTTDPNKDTNSRYCQEIFRDSAEHLIECHGAGQRRKLDLELSAGSNELANPVGFGTILASELLRPYTLGAQRYAGSTSAIIFEKDGTRSIGQLALAAIETKSLIEAEAKGISALHLEAKPQFRILMDEPNTVTPDGLILGCALAETIIKCWIKGDRTCQS